MIRLTTLLPCVVLHVAFIGGTPGYFRHEILRELKERISGCTFRVVKDVDDLDVESEGSETIEGSDSTSSPTGIRTNMPCCVLMRKPIDKILIRYNKIPSNFTASFESYFQEPESRRTSGAKKSDGSLSSMRRSHSSGVSSAVMLPIVQAATDTLATLSRYLHHKRWLWMTKAPLINESNGACDISTIISKLVRKRLSEGFHFAYNKMGIMNLTMEIDMIFDVGSKKTSSHHAFPCIIQYILFPAQTTISVGKE